MYVIPYANPIIWTYQVDFKTVFCNIVAYNLHIMQRWLEPAVHSMHLWRIEFKPETIYYLS